MENVAPIKGTSPMPHRRDADFFIFLTQNRIDGASNFLQNTELSKKLKYKIILFRDETKSKNLACLTFNPYKNQVVPLKLTKNTTLFFDFTSNFHGKPIRMAATIYYIPVYEFVKAKTGNYYEQRGFVAEILQAIRTRLNMTYTLIPCTPDGLSGSRMKNGTWQGCMGDVIADRADMAVFVAPDNERYGHVEFSSAMAYSFITFYIQKPEGNLGWDSIFKSFTSRVWLLMVGSIIFTSIVIFLNEKEFKRNPQRFAKILLGLFDIFVGQIATVPKRGSSKLLFLLWMLYALVMSTAYTSKLKSLMTSPEVETVPSSFTDLASSSYRFGMPKSFRRGLGENIFKQSNVPAIKWIYNAKETVKDEPTCLKRASEKKYACISWNVFLNFVVGTIYGNSKGDSPFRSATAGINIVSPGAIMQKQSIFRERFDKQIINAENTGLMGQMYNMDMSMLKTKLNMKTAKNGSNNDLRHHHQRMQGTSEKPLNYDNCKGCYFVYNLGIVISILVFSVQVQGNQHLQTISSLHQFINVLLAQPQINQCSFSFTYTGNDFNSMDQLSEFISTVSEKVIPSSVQNLIHLLQWKGWLPQKRLRCYVIISIIHSYKSELEYSNLFLENVVPIKGTIPMPHRRDTDFFIFLTNQGMDNSTKLLQDTDLSRKLKYKIVLFQDQSKKNLTSLTVNPYKNVVVPVILTGNFRLFFDFTSNFYGQSIRMAATTYYIPTYEIVRASTGIYYEKRGFVAEILQAIRTRLNLTYSVIPCTPDGLSGSLMKNGSWQGCMGDVISNRADMAVFVGPDEERYGHVEFGSPIAYGFITFYIKKPQVYLQWDSIYKSFTLRVWLLMIGSIVFTSILLFVKETKSIRDAYRFFEIYLGLFDILVSQKATIPKRVSSKLLLLLWMLYALVMGTAYTSKLTSLMTSPKVEVLPSSFIDLASSNYRFGVSNSFRKGLAENLFKHSNAPAIKRIYNALETFKDGPTCLKMAFEKKYACISWNILLKFLAGTIYRNSKGDIPFNAAKAGMNIATPGAIVQKQSIFRERFAKQIIHAQSTGLIEQMYNMDMSTIRLKRKLSLQKTTNERKIDLHHDQSSTERPLNNDNCKGCYFVYILGIVISFLFFTSERLFIVIVQNKI
ncbi:unnamed protein product [Orchesella dallaii]|uniref:Ionotropic glutamate receptor L-glutamate and glycine-binding domain-containing protein n=1 Tax=Orchesella dallaii TaxID=48710 RepID=A0ABP1QS20_9HEXA